MLAVGTAHYQDDQFDDLKLVPDAVRRMIDTFETLGFETQDLLNPTKAAFEDTIESWLQGPAWAADDVAVLYVTGHGISAAAGHYLAMTDSVADRYAKAVPTSFVSSALGDDPSIGQFLVILDTCYSESGGDELVGLAASMKRNWPEQGGRQYWVVSSARARQEAQQLVFAQAFTMALVALRESFGSQTPSIPLTSVVGRTNVLLEHPPFSVAHRATVASLVPAPGDDGFFENPEYGGPGHVVLASEVVPTNELRGYWLPRALGRSGEGTSLFQGRERLIEEIATWATDPGQPGLLVVKGSPGTGKSALLAQILVRSLGTEMQPKTGRVPLVRAVHAGGQTSQSIRQRVADLLQMPADYGTRVVLIDALDEAVDPDQIEVMVLAPLLSAGLRVAVGTRPALAGSFVSSNSTIDLDQHWNSSEVEHYAAKLLSDDASSPYNVDAIQTQEVAAAVAALAGASFLLAGQIARTLARMDRALTASSVVSAQRSFGSLASAFERDLSRIRDDTGAVRELLIALAWSRGAGLPWEGIWPAVASALFAPSRFTDNDVRQLLSTAGDYVVETSVGGRSYFRLYHELFAEHLRKGIDTVEAHATLTKALVNLTPTDEHGEKNWESAHPYVRSVLVEHAVRGGLLDALLIEPRLSLAVDAERLAVVLSGIRHRSVGSNEAAVMRALEHLKAGPGERISQLALAALQAGATELSERAISLTRRRGSQWWPQWVRWAKNPAYTTISRVKGRVQGICVVDNQGEMLAIAAAADGEVVCTAVTSGRTVWGRTYPKVSAIAAAGHVVVLGTGDGPIYVIGAYDGSELAVIPGPETNRETASTSALAVHVGGSQVLVAAGTYNERDDDVDNRPFVDWGGKLRLWRIDDLDRPVWVKQAFGNGVRTLAFRSASGSLQLVAGGDPFGEPRVSQSVARVYDVNSGELCYKLPNQDLAASYADAVACPDGSVLLIPLRGGFGNPITRWNPESGTMSTRVISDQLADANALTKDGKIWFLATYKDLLTLSTDTLEPLRKTMANGVAATAIAFADTGARTFVLTGAASGETTRWDLEAFTDADTNRPPRIGACAAVAPDLITYSVDDGSAAVETASRADGALIARIELEASALHSMGSRDEVFVGHSNGVVDRYLARTLERVDTDDVSRGDGRPLHTGPVTSMADSDGILVTCGRDARVELSHPETGPVCPPLMHVDYKNRPLDQVRIVELNGAKKIVALDYNGELVIWGWREAVHGEAAWWHEDGRNTANSFPVTALSDNAGSFCSWQPGRQTIFFRPGRHGSVDTWIHPERSREEWPAHERQITCLEMLTNNVLLTADATGQLRAWELPQRRLITEASLGSTITSLCPVDEQTLVVGTSSGLALLKFAVAMGKLTT